MPGSESSEVSLQQIPFDQDVFNEACDHLSTSLNGEVKELCDGELKLYISEVRIRHGLHEDYIYWCTEHMLVYILSEI